MRHSRVCLSLIVTLTTAVIFGQNFAFAQTEAPSQTPPPAAPAPSFQPPSPALGPYKPVPITLPKSVSDPSFEAFRKELAEIAQKRDRAALAARVAANFFWIPEARDLADRRRPGIDNLAKALGLDAPDGVGWDTIAAYAGEASTAADQQRSAEQRALCPHAGDEHERRSECANDGTNSRERREASAGAPGSVDVGQCQTQRERRGHTEQGHRDGEEQQRREE